MKKTHWLRNTLIVLIICGLVGTLIAAIQFSKEAGRTSASATIQFSFQGAGEGKAPNGYPFDLSGVTSEEVLNNALETSGLKDKYTAEQLRENITVTGVYPKAIVEQMTQYVSLLDKDAESQAAVTDYHATEYSIVLYNDFDSSISSETLTGLLGNILTAYRSNFTKTYGVTLGNDLFIAGISEYDYAQQLDVITESAEQEKRYAQEMAEMAPDFRVEGKGFGDIAARYNAIISDIERLNASVTINAISRDPERLKMQYETVIKAQQFKLEALNEELKRIEEQIKSYEKNGIVYISAGGEITQIGTDKTGTYDKLVAKRKEVTDQITTVKAKIALYQGRLADMTGTAKAENEEETTVALTDAEKNALLEKTEKEMEELVAKKTAVSNEFAAMLDAYSTQEINESTVSVTALRYKAPSVLSGTFAVLLVKTAGPFCVLGFIVCLVLLIISRRKEEKAKS